MIKGSRPSAVPDNWRSLTKEELREAFRKDRESAGYDELPDDPELAGLSYKEGATVIARRIRRRLESGEDASGLESRLLLALIEGRAEEYARLSDILTRRNLLGLSVLKGGKPAPHR